MELAAHRGLATMNSAETNPKERGLGKPCAGKPPARFDEGEGSVPGDRLAALSTLPNSDSAVCRPLSALRFLLFKSFRVFRVFRGPTLRPLSPVL